MADQSDQVRFEIYVNIFVFHTAFSKLYIQFIFLLYVFEVPIKIPFGEKEIDAVVSTPNRTSWQGCGVILTHGVGGDMHHKHLEALAKYLCSAGILCLRFTMKTPNFKYRVKCFAAAVVSKLKIKYINLFCCLQSAGKGRCVLAIGRGGGVVRVHTSQLHWLFF